MQFAAIIVSYNPETNKLLKTIGELGRQGFSVIVVDNASTRIEAVREASRGAKLIEFTENRGIAAALNEGMRTAKEIGAQWVLSLDQDSMIAPNMLDEYKNHIGLPDTGALCPAIVKRGEGVADTTRQGISQVDRCPTAGFLLNVDAWEEVGYYDEWMFIDYVDYDICIRLRIAGFKIYRIESTYVIQELGRMVVHQVPYTIGKMLGWKRLQSFATTYNHSPLRNYYYVRNSLHYIRKYGDSIIVHEELLKVLKWELKKLLLEDDRSQIIKSIFDGIRDCKG